MYELCDHLITEHKVKDIVWVSGLAGNKENEERCRAVTECMAKHGLSLTEDHTINGDWSFYVVQGMIREWLETHELPDAFICANDIMAMGVLTYLIDQGYQLPQDCIVTGFDNIKSSRTFIRYGRRP